jgi:hypothetical protein
MNLKSGPRIRKFTALMCATVLEIILIPPVAAAIQEASVSGGTVSGVIKHGVVSFNDPVTMVSVVTHLGAMSLLACYFPARRAMRRNP